MFVTDRERLALELPRVISKPGLQSGTTTAGSDSAHAARGTRGLLGALCALSILRTDLVREVVGFDGD